MKPQNRWQRFAWQSLVGGYLDCRTWTGPAELAAELKALPEFNAVWRVVRKYQRRDEKKARKGSVWVRT